MASSKNSAAITITSLFWSGSYLHSSYCIPGFRMFLCELQTLPPQAARSATHISMGEPPQAARRPEYLRLLFYLINNHIFINHLMIKVKLKQQEVLTFYVLIRYH